MAKAAPTALDHAAQPVLDLLEDMDLKAQSGVGTLVETTAAALDTFERDAARGGIATPAIKPARYALAMLFDTRARSIEGVSLASWSVLAQRHLFDRHDMPISRIRDFRDKAAEQGETYADLERFLTGILAKAQEQRHGHKRIESSNWGLRIAAYLLILAIGVIGYAGWLEHRFHAKLIAAFDAEALNIGLDRAQEGDALISRLNSMEEAVDRVSLAARRAPLRRIVRLPFGDGESHANAVYQNAVATHAPQAIADGIEDIIATEGDGLILYDALRAWSILTGDDAWSTAYLEGWLQDNGSSAGLEGLASHVTLLAGPSPNITPRDTALMDQAREFAAEVAEPDRAWLELARSERMRALPEWRPTVQIADLGTVVLHRSGRSIDEGIPGLFTAAGWNEARDFAVGGAVQRARSLAPLITGRALPPQNNSPDLLLDRLHLETLATWKSWLADLRVRPFAQRETAIIVSGSLAQPDNPLTRLLREVWVQTGGTDRARTHAQQLAIAREFGAMIQYVEQGRMAEISQLFSQLNVALGAIDTDANRGTRRLMSIQDRARSIAALKSAPRMVVQIAEDVLAQSAQPEQGQASNPLTRGWQTQVFPLCHAAMGAQYPFTNGPDANPADVAALFGPQGALSTFVRQSAAPFLETEDGPWRWKPEARFAGVTPESAIFLERAMQVSEGLFGPQGRLEFDLTLAALAERGRTIVAIGGVAEPVRATGVPAQLRWPGPQPNIGIEISFRESSEAGRIIHAGPWGLMRLIDSIRLRQRDGGRRILLDLRSDAGRVFMEMQFQTDLNPVSVRAAMRGLQCPPAL